jgi:transcriptional regulator of acetoin/glycerol metabolism
VPVKLPPLREREGRLPLLVAALRREARGGRQFTVKTDVLEAMADYSWPGNVRELENHVAQAIAMSGGATVLKKEHLLPVDKTRRAALEPPTTLQVVARSAGRSRARAPRHSCSAPSVGIAPKPPRCSASPARCCGRS